MGITQKRKPIHCCFNPPHLPSPILNTICPRFPSPHGPLSALYVSAAPTRPFI
ncbi:hypothetical protein K505DRAFT_321398 [Melanomma pulvis-pyrius CBS 109.77]|uniref:Uncharacterized protein n=1 Tax=Melanomma pulvis-pyrius CBS 109.77 TaxID=1314802 RepID=A0A6A6XS38_9PLEO|nr:hypothetical protein K505DRAFT_321398 [Melanomma pulvis-pyrius CBS 109.77]